jgi:hypothetical protein
MAENRLTQIAGQILYESDSAVRFTQIAGQILYPLFSVPIPDGPQIFKPGGFGVQIID